MKRIAFTVCMVIMISSLVLAQENTVPGPSFKDVLELKSASNPKMSPDGRSVLFSVRQVDWEENGYDSEIWLSRHGSKPFQLTRTQKGSSSSYEWSPDGQWISFISSRDKGRQLYIINPMGGEAVKITSHEPGIGGYLWSPDGSKIAFLSTDEESEDSKNREKLYGRFAVEDEEFRMTHLWVVDFDPAGEAKPKRLTEGNEFTVGSIEWSPDGRKIAFDHRPNTLINTYQHTDLSVIDVSSGQITPLVTQPSSDGNPWWSPDGQWILFRTSMGNFEAGKNSELARIPAGGGDIEVLTENFDENLSVRKWSPNGIYCIASQKTARQLFLLDPETKEINTILDTPEIISSVSFSKDDKNIALQAESRTAYSEIYVTPLNNYRPVKLTDMGAQIKNWSLGTREVIEWKSKDGAMIEGILMKPANFDPNKKYPLLVSIHGGPTGTSRPYIAPGGVYPYLQWLEKGAVIMQPNYRGSAGYGEKFRQLNVRNLGVGDMWDVESGVDYLIKQGFVDKDRVASMGWSQGGYISAFLTTNSKKFKAISVGAGISNWVTYYVNTDIHRFTQGYLKATPWDDMKVYEKTSPMTNIRKAQTPTLIQHGEFDRRVPVPNAYELYQGLQDVGVEVKLIIYKNFGHGISRPKERLAAIWHNWQWFAKHIWNEEVKIPLEVEKEKDK